MIKKILDIFQFKNGFKRISQINFLDEFWMYCNIKNSTLIITKRSKELILNAVYRELISFSWIVVLGISSNEKDLNPF